MNDNTSEIQDIETLSSTDDNGDFELLSEEEVDSLSTEKNDTAELEELGVFEEFTEILLEPNIQEKLPMAFRLTRRFVVFLSFMMVSLITIFYIGNEQNFLDSDLKLVLRMNTFVSIMLALMCIFAFVQCIFCIFIEKKLKYLFYSIAFIFVLALATVAGFFSRSVNMISDGFLG